MLVQANVDCCCGASSCRATPPIEKADFQNKDDGPEDGTFWKEARPFQGLLFSIGSQSEQSLFEVIGCAEAEQTIDSIIPDKTALRNQVVV